MALLALINISNSLYITTINTGGLDVKETKNMLSNAMTIMIITSLISAIILYIKESRRPLFTTVLLLVTIIAIAKAIIVMNFDNDDWLLYIGLSVLILALAGSVKLLSDAFKDAEHLEEKKIC